MNLQNKNKGFTIVELLIVIVVIGILAAITIVAYNGIQNRSNTTAAQSNAGTIEKKAQAFNSINAYYPKDETAFNSTDESKLDSGIKIVTGNTTNKNEVRYVPCPAGQDQPTGAKISYYDFSARAMTPEKTIGTCN